MFKKLSQWLAVTASVFTMTLSPVAEGAQAQRVTKQQMQQTVDALGLNRQITLGQFFERNKDLMSPAVKEQLEPFFAEFKNTPMPTFEVISSKGPTGEEIATVRMTSNEGDLINLQWFGHSNKMVKIQNTVLSHNDLANFDDVFARLSATEQGFRKQYQKNLKVEANKSGKYSFKNNYPAVSKKEWKSMSAYNKANYIINMRKVWSDAMKVIEASEAAGSKKTSQNFINKNQHFFAMFFGLDVEAQVPAALLDGSDTAQKAVTPLPPVVGAKPAVAEVAPTGGIGVQDNYSGKRCILAGYTTKLLNGRCTKGAIDQVYSDDNNQIYQKAKNLCGASKIACNPYVFGTPNGAPTCVALSSAAIQTASHWDKVCDAPAKLSKLNTTDRAAEQAEQLKDNYAQTKEFLLGLLKFTGKVGKEQTVKDVFDGQMSEEIHTQTVKSLYFFNQDIKRANELCANPKNQTGNERNFKGACDQLGRRFLFLQEIYQAKCSSPDKFNTETMKCACEGSTEVIPGAQCSTPDSKLASPDDSKFAESCQDADVSGIQMPACKCPEGQVIKTTTVGENTERAVRTCGPIKTIPEVKPKKNCGLFCKVWKGVKKVGPWILAGVVGYMIFRHLSPAKPKLAAAPDKCADGSVAPCKQTCELPKSLQSDGSCGCTCPLGTTPNATCGCVTDAATTPTTGGAVNCPDNLTTADTLANCKVYCTVDGVAKQNPFECTDATPTTPTEEPVTEPTPSPSSGGDGSR